MFTIGAWFTGWIIRALLRVGVGEARASAIGTSPWLGKGLAALGVVVVLGIGVWQLIDYGGDRREAQIRAVWEARNKALAAEQAKLASERAELKLVIDKAVRDAVEGVKGTGATLSPEAVRRINAIGRGRR